MKGERPLSLVLGLYVAARLASGAALNATTGATGYDVYVALQQMDLCGEGPTMSYPVAAVREWTLTLRRLRIMKSKAVDVRLENVDRPLSAQHRRHMMCLPSPQPPRPYRGTLCPAGAAYCCIKGCAKWDCQICKKFPGMAVTEIHSTKHNGKARSLLACPLTLPSPIP
jgi:hypothetical protein